jgi:hypothetical protein
MLLIITQAPVPIPRQAPNGAAYAHSKPEDKAYSGNPPPASALAVALPKKDDTPYLKADSDQGKDAHSPQVVVDVIKMPIRDRFDWITWGGGILLTIVGIGGIIVAVCTLKKIERQTKATEDSIRLQEIAYYQWVEIVNWTSSLNARSSTPQLDISVEVINSTDFPITLNHVEVSFIAKPRKTVYVPTRDRFLPPKTPLKLSVTIDISEESRVNFMNNAFGMLIAGNISFEGVLRRPTSQNVEGVLICGPRETRFDPIATMHPKPNTNAQEGES